MANEYSFLTGLADVFNKTAETVVMESGEVVQNVVATAGTEAAVTAAVLGGGAYYGYGKYKAE